jgi:hypothetical protein
MHRLFTEKTAAGFSHATIFANEFKCLPFRKRELFTAQAPLEEHCEQVAPEKS